jgi:hypothetical protein
MSDKLTNTKPDWPLWYQRSILPFIEESALWPVLIAIWGHLVVALAAYILHQYRTVSPLLGLLGIWLCFLSYKAIQFERTHRGRMAGLSFTVISSWLCSVLLAKFVDYSGLY